MRFLSLLKDEKIYKWIAYVAILLGIIVRIAVYLQSRNLFIDEANVARNIFERGFLGLALPLNYEQYAPPIFLWITDLSTQLFGYGELAFRLFPLLAGIASLFIAYSIMRQLGVVRTAWYGMAMLALGYIFIRYSTELKQYMNDILVVLSLLLLAMKTDVFKTKQWRFLLQWFVVGSISIWASMPSVFALASVGMYYGIILLQGKAYKKLLPVGLLGVLWLGQFYFYFKKILEPQIDSPYLQNFHADFFLHLIPKNAGEFQHNIGICHNLLGDAAGFTFLASVFHLLCFALAIVAGIKRDMPKLLLIISPIIFAMIAACFNQYSLIPRVALFTMPLFLILISYGFDVMLKVRFTVIKVVAVLIACICLVNHVKYQNAYSMAWERQQTEEVTDAMSFVMEKGIDNGNSLYVHNGARPAFIYYTTIHPGKEKWNKIKNAHLLSWDADYDTLSAQAFTPAAFIYTSVYMEDLNAKKAIIEKYMIQVDHLEKTGCYAYIYKKK